MKKQKRNTPVTTLIKDFTNKKSGKVSVSRDEIIWRFDYLDWKDQKKILMAFLDSGKTDRAWAYKKLLRFWDKSFEQQVRKLWETYHEERCSWSVIRYFPLDYITQHMADFTDRRDYYFICLRLAQDPNFAIDRSRLSKTDFLSLLHHTGRNLSDGESRDTLYNIVHDCCVSRFSITQLERISLIRKNEVITPTRFHEVSLALYYLEKLGKYPIIEEFDKWIEELGETIVNSPELKSIREGGVVWDDYDRKTAEVAVAKLYAYKALAEKYRQVSDPSLEEIQKACEEEVEWLKDSQGSNEPYWRRASYLDLSQLTEEDVIPF